MLRKIKRYFLVILAFFLICGILKDMIFDTPLRAKNNIGSLSSAVSHRVLVYKMYYGSILPIGTLNFAYTSKEDTDIYSAQATTLGSFIEKFIEASARIETHFLKKNGLPYQYIETTVVKDKQKSKEIFFDQENLLVTRDDRKIKIAEPTYDPLGAFVHLLTLPLEKGVIHQVRCLAEDVVYIMKGDVVFVSGGVAKISIDIRRDGQPSGHGASFDAWITDDNSRSPLVFKSWTPVGYVSVVLNKVEVQ
ncbi:MAG: DUF3108 domain-containing protein [Candidatus Omnitrophica bacterium]|nr:DUF3108 domain-containing protein [Candidatus Omnitrophota bacterium]